jgi:hypothetical protein
MYHLTIPLPLPYVEKETSCLENSSSYFSIANQEEGLSTDNGTLQVTPMVILGSHFFHRKK